MGTSGKGQRPPVEKGYQVIIDTIALQFFYREYFFDPLIFFSCISDNGLESGGIYRYWDGLELHGRTG